jgi:predicted nucleic-acid-binding protein
MIALDTNFLFRKSKVELSDALIGAKARAKGARTTYTF